MGNLLLKVRKWKDERRKAREEQERLGVIKIIDAEVKRTSDERDQYQDEIEALKAKKAALIQEYAHAKDGRPLSLTDAYFCAAVDQDVARLERQRREALQKFNNCVQTRQLAVSSIKRTDQAHDKIMEQLTKQLKDLQSQNVHTHMQQLQEAEKTRMRVGTHVQMMVEMASDQEGVEPLSIAKAVQEAKEGVRDDLTQMDTVPLNEDEFERITRAINEERLLVATQEMEKRLAEATQSLPEPSSSTRGKSSSSSRLKKDRDRERAKKTHRGVEYAQVD